jgi:hypothetical protein
MEFFSTIFDELEVADVMLVNGIVTTNFGWNADDPDEHWSLSVNGYDADRCSEFAYYFMKADLQSAKTFGDAWIIENRNHPSVTLEFCKLRAASDAI